jgi:hypothetical protein
MSAEARPLGDFLACMYGPIVWATHFFIVYGAESVMCLGASSPATAMRWTVFGATAIALAAIAIPLARSVLSGQHGDTDARRFLRTVRNWLAVLSAAAVLAVAVSASPLTACVSPAG